MVDSTWKAMNDLDEAFNQIGTFDFLLDQLQRHVDEQNQQGIVDTSHALLAFLPPYIQNFDEKFQVAWKQTVQPQLVNVDWEGEAEWTEDAQKYYDTPTD